MESLAIDLIPRCKSFGISVNEALAEKIAVVDAIYDI